MNQFLTQISVAPPWLWGAFTAGVLVLLLVDLSIFGRGTHKVSRRSALLESAAWITVALCFNLWFGFHFGRELGVEFFTGYLIEKSLSVDNLFLILLIFTSFRIPAQNQHRVLFYGVLGAIVLRAFFIVAGAQLLHHFHWILYVFGAVLVATAVKLLLDKEENAEEMSESFSVRLLRKFIPTTSRFDGKKFFLLEKGVRKATPLFLALIVTEITDLIFAVDSIPAVFAVTQDAFVAFASNILAILGLRALYFVLADSVGELRFLKPGLAAILGFIGTKMLIVDYIKIPSGISLVVIFVILAIAALGSWYFPHKEHNLDS